MNDAHSFHVCMLAQLLFIMYMYDEYKNYNVQLTNILSQD